MSGRRHHFLPQFLQRGFTSAPGCNQTWVYRKGNPPQLNGISNVGIERDFYSYEGNASVDDAITEAEGEEFAPLVNAAREGRARTLSDEDCARLFAHLEVRSRNLRHGVLQLSDYLSSKTVERLQVPGLLEEIFKRRFQRKPETILEVARLELRAKGLPETFASQIADLGKQNLAQTGSAAQMIAMLLPTLKTILPLKLRDAAKQGHLKALTRDIAPEIRIEGYRRLYFRVHDVDASNLVLGDSAVIFDIQGTGQRFKPFVDKDDRVLAAILPVSSRRVIVGSDRDYPLEPEVIRQHAVRCALEFFVAATDSAQNRKISEEIGVYALPLTEQDLDQIIGQVIDEELR